jgi:4-hydroxythreonine-4-phosphate dehydrogenase
MKPILITLGDPAGVGAEVALKALAQGAAGPRPVALVGDAAVWQRAADRVGAAWPIWQVGDFALPTMTDPADSRDEYRRERGEAQRAAITTAVRACVNGAAAAVVTMPIDKRALHAAGVPFAGHTEFIAHLCGVARPVMMLFGPQLRVVPITTHIPYAEVPARLTVELVLDTLRIVHRDLRRLFRVNEPRLALCGLNPHAGEGGLLGREEIDVLIPAVQAARRDGLTVDGPLPADSAFVGRGAYDAVLCPTHDQALIPLKQRHFDCGVNVTLGLPIVRTSPDHGTARDLAWRNQADPRSAAAAIRAAVDFAARTGSI